MGIYTASVSMTGGEAAQDHCVDAGDRCALIAEGNTTDDKAKHRTGTFGHEIIAMTSSGTQSPPRAQQAN